MMMASLKEHKTGIVTTVIFHAVVIILLIIFGLHIPLPLPKEEALLINFGTGNTGSGLLEPGGSPAPSAIPPAKVQERPTETQKAKEKILTQDTEKAPAVESGKKTKPRQPSEEEIKKQKQNELKKKKQQEEMERNRQAELERKRQEDIERKRREEEQRKIKEITERTQHAFANARGNANTSSEGETGKQGNQGNPQGSSQTGAHSGTPGTGNGGISYSLAGRIPQKLPLPEYNYQVAGIVVVEVTVDRNGNVTKANPGMKGSTTLDEYLLRVAKKAALASKFNRKPDAPAYQKGTITYHFILQ